MLKRDLPDAVYLRECFDYGPETGILRWRDRPPSHFSNPGAAAVFKNRFAGNVAGGLNTNGYRRIRLGSRILTASRVAWKMMTGEDPPVVDHINHAVDDNRIANLRGASMAENSRNMLGHKDRGDPTALKGAYKSNNGWVALIGLNCKQLYIGYFTTELAAHQAYCQKSKELHGQFGRRN